MMNNSKQITDAINTIAYNLKIKPQDIMSYSIKEIISCGISQLTVAIILFLVSVLIILILIKIYKKNKEYSAFVFTACPFIFFIVLAIIILIAFGINNLMAPEAKAIEHVIELTRQLN